MSGKYNNTTNLFDKKTDYCFFYTDYDEPVRERINYDEDEDEYILSPRVDLRTGIQEARVFYRTIDVSSLDLDEKDLEILEDIKETFKVGE